MASTPPRVSKYPFPSEVKVGEIVPVKLKQHNYVVWRKLMLDFIERQGLVGFINGTIRPPPTKLTVPADNSSQGTAEIENQDYQDWKRSDLLVRVWIFSTLSEKILVYVLNLKTARHVWEDLEKNLNTFPLHRTPETMTHKEEGKSLSHYFTLYKAALRGDWESARLFVEQEPDAVRAAITVSSDTALMVAARSGKRAAFVKELVELMSPEDLAIGDISGFTALHVAALVGNLEVAKLLVSKNSRLPNVWDADRTLPIHRAALGRKREMVLYLLTVTREDAEPKPFKDGPGRGLVPILISNGLYDIALTLLQRFPELAWEDPSPLLAFTLDHSAFPSGTRLNFWQGLIHSCIPAHGSRDISSSANTFISVRRKLYEVAWRVSEILVPQIKHIKETKMRRHEALQIVKWLCMETLKLECSKASSLFKDPLHLSAIVGIKEVVEEIMVSFPSAVYLRNALDQTIFHSAVLHRREDVFNLIYQIEGSRQVLLSSQDIEKRNCLHLAGFLAPWQKLSLRTKAAGAALQLQRELQWFKEVEKLALPQDKEQENSKKLTPSMEFISCHEELIKEGEQWMKDAANSCTVVATLIVSVLFAAAITVPGGNNSDTGLPNFSRGKAFTVFAISDMIALFSSTSSIIMFLSILTSRYAAEDFLYALPKRLIIGLVTLFLSILSMMIAFGATLYAAFGQNKLWVLIVVIVLACLPVTLFMFLQFHLLLDMIKFTYFPGIFGKRSDRALL